MGTSDKIERVRGKLLHEAKLAAVAAANETDSLTGGVSTAIGGNETSDDDFFAFKNDSNTPQSDISLSTDMECLRFLEDPGHDLKILHNYLIIKKLFYKYTTHP